MNIVLIAHDNKKELMGDFCTAYKFILSKHKLYATAGTGAIISKSAGLEAHRFSYGLLGGMQQIEAMLSLNEIDMVIYFRDPFQDMGQRKDINSILTQCDLNSVPFATNIATAEILINGLERGDLSWRELVKPIKGK